MHHPTTLLAPTSGLQGANRLHTRARTHTSWYIHLAASDGAGRRADIDEVGTYNTGYSLPHTHHQRQCAHGCHFFLSPSSPSFSSITTTTTHIHSQGAR